MRDHDEALAAAGARVAAIGTGDMAYAEDFRAKQRLPFDLLVDEERTTYRIVGARRGSVTTLVTPRTLGRGVRAVVAGNMQGRSGRDPLLLGATHVIGPDGAVAFAWINDDYADNAPIAAVLAALR